MKKILIRIQSSNELLSYESISLAMTLSTFDYYVQLVFDIKSFGILAKPNGRIYNMLKSLPLYDLPPIWLDDPSTDKQHIQWIKQIIDDELSSQLTELPRNINSQFDSILIF